MKRGVFRSAARIAPGIIPFLLILAFRFIAPFSNVWMRFCALPFSHFLHGMTARFSFPLLELIPSAIIGGFIFSGVLLWRKNLFLWLRLVFYVIWSILLVYILLWFPAYWVGENTDNISPDSGQLTWLCEYLIDELNQSSLDFPGMEETFRHTEDDIYPGTALKAARYPEWMNRFNIAGLYSPWTGEVIINPDTPTPALPFTAIHELMHLGGIADEGAANIAAWRLCMDAGGYFADSARLWALKYAVQRLLSLDPSALSSLYARMNPPLRAAFHSMGGEHKSPDSSVLRWLGLSKSMGNYDVLAAYLLQPH